MKLAFILSLALAACLIVFSGQKCEGVDILFPPDLALSNKSSVTVMGNLEGETFDKGSVNGLRKFPIDGDGPFSGEAKLYPGLNILRVGDVTSRVFFIDGALLSNYTLKTDDGETRFTTYRLHPALEDGCEACHAFEDEDISLNEEVPGLCMGCHDDPVKDGEGEEYANVHGPVSDGDCLSCHDPHFSRDVKLLKGKDLCIECHDDKSPEEGEFTSIHEPFRKKQCTLCHSPHASPYEYQVRKKGNSLCLSCHKNPHRQHRSSKVRGTMTKLPLDFPVEKDGTLTCSGCHDPHVSDERRLFRNKEKELCATCHNM